MKNTKQKIAEAAKKSFNKHGFGQVTLRMIANELEMSCGNLNYHFKKREDLLELLYFEMVEQFDKRIKALPQLKISFPTIFQEIKTSMERMLDYRFFWTDIYNLLNLNPTIQRHFQDVYQQRINGYLLLFRELHAQGFLKKAAYENEYEFIARQMVHFSNTWLYARGLYTNEINANVITENAQHLLGILYPYCTRKGQAELQALIF